MSPTMWGVSRVDAEIPRNSLVLMFRDLSARVTPTPAPIQIQQPAPPQQAPIVEAKPIANSLEWKFRG